MSFPGSGAFFSFGMSVMSALRRCTVGRSDPEALLLGSVPRMRKPSLPRKDEIIALCMLVCALIIIGLAATGVLQLRGETRSPVAQIVAK
jgi:hypothetical protein